MSIKLFLINKLLKKNNEVIEEFLNCLQNNSGGLFTYFNQNSFNHFWTNIDYQKILRYFNVYQEGVGMYLALKFLGVFDCDRIDSTEMNKSLIQKIISLDESVIFIGGKYDSNDLIIKCGEKSLNIEYYQDGYINDDEIDTLIKKFSGLNSKFVLLGMGTPKQEFFALKLYQNFPNKIFICIGNFMNYFIGYQKRAPKILRKLQLEWLYRLLQEPRRLFKRYVLGIPVFLIRVIFLCRR